MAEKIDFAYMEFLSRVEQHNFSTGLDEIVLNIEKSAVHTFGWPLVLVNRSYPKHAPKPVADGVEARFYDVGHRDYWIVKRNTEMYYLGELFENNRDARKIFLDTRTIRITEVFMRVQKFYVLMGVPEDKNVDIMIRHENIKDRILGAGSPRRLFDLDRRCNVNEVTSNFSSSLRTLGDKGVIQEFVFQAVRDLAEMFDMFHPSKEQFTDPIVDAYLSGRII